MTKRCVICGDPMPDAGLYCEACDDIPQLDPFASIAVDAVLLRRLERQHAIEGGLIVNVMTLLRAKRSRG